MPERRAKKTDDAHRATPRTPAAPSAAKAAPKAAPANLARAVDPAELGAASPAQVRQLHRAIGNRALNRLLANKTIQAKLTVGPADDRFEREADQAAAAVMRQAQTTTAAGRPGEDEAAIQRLPQPGPSVGLEGGDVSGDIEARLSASRGAGRPLPDATRAQMEHGLGADFSGVRIHTDSAAHDLNRELGAQAFTHGADVYMAPGKYSPGSSAGQHLLAHELTHVVQQGASTVRRRARRPAAASPVTETTSEGVIHRKLSGITEALTTLGDTPSLKSKGKALFSGLKEKVGKSTLTEGSGKYAQIVKRLENYEKLEAKLLSKNPPALTPAEVSDAWGELKQVELLVGGWLDENAHLAYDQQAAGDILRNNQLDATLANESVEQRRYHALRLLLPRLRHEMMQITSGRFFESQPWSDRSLDRDQSVDDRFGGEVNRLDLVTHRGQTGVFTQDKTWADALTVGSTLGISPVDPNAGARSVAMYELARLLDLGVDVIAKTEFATHTSATNKKDQPLAAPMAKMGVRQEMAPGQEAAKTPTTLTADEARARGGDTISLEDPVLQRSLNAIQLIDAIAGQIDRHWHNYYVNTDKQGRVIGVIGIDLDMAFAPDHRTVVPATDSPNDLLKGAHFVGMPALVDSEFARRIVGVGADAVRALLRNYLSEAEVGAALERFRLVQEACRGILERNEAVLPGGWGADTAHAQLTGDLNNSYLGKMAQGTTKHEFVGPAESNTMNRIKDGTASRDIRSKLIPELEALLLSKTLSLLECFGLLEVIYDNFQAAPDVEQRPLIKTLTTTPIANWNQVLAHPPASPLVLLKAREQLFY